MIPESSTWNGEGTYLRCWGCGCTPEFRCLPNGCELLDEDAGLCSACADPERPFHAHGISA